MVTRMAVLAVVVSLASSTSAWAQHVHTWVEHDCPWVEIEEDDSPVVLAGQKVTFNLGEGWD